MLMSPRARPSTFAVISFVALAQACAVRPHAPDAAFDGEALTLRDGTEAPPLCTDNDRDNYGVGCRAGADCDDTDPDITNECYRCASPATGCPCSDPGERRACDALTDTTRPGLDGTCHPGARTCADGVWSRCMALDGSNRTIWGPLPCPGVCDPTCQDYPACPTTAGDLAGGTNVVIGDAPPPVWCPPSPGGIILEPIPGTVSLTGTVCTPIPCGLDRSCCGTCYAYSNADRQAPALCSRHGGGGLATGDPVCGQTCATGTTHCGVAPWDACCTATQDCRFGVCIARGSATCRTDADCASSAQCAAPPCYCNATLGSTSAYCAPVSPGQCGCGSDTARQGCLSSVVAQGGTIMEDIFRTSDGLDARHLRFARYVRGLASNPSGTCPVGETAARTACDGTGLTCTNLRDAATLASHANSLDWRWVLEQRVDDSGAAAADGDTSSFYPWRSVVYDLGARSNRVVVFPVVAPDPQAAGAAVNACSGPLAFTVWMSDDPNATQINTSTTPDPRRWNATRLITIFTDGWTRNADSTGDPMDPADYATTSGGAASADGMVTEWQVACGADFRYAAITAGFQGGGGSLNPCAQGRVRNVIDAVAGLDDNGRVPGIVHSLPYGTTAGPDAVVGVPVPSVDVYFLADSSASMTASIGNVRAAVTTTGEFFPGCPGGVMAGVRCVLPDSWFGAGQVQDLPVAPYGLGGQDQYFIHGVDETSDISAVAASIGTLIASGADTGLADPLEAQVPALWSLATGRGVQPVDNTGTVYSYLTDRGACVAGGVGYACFRASTLPVIVHFTDQSRYHNGPGGTNPYDDFTLSGSTPLTYPAVATALNGSDAYSMALTPFVSGSPPETLSGTTSGVANDDTSAVCGGAGRDVVYQFNLAVRSRVHADTSGTTLSSPILYVRNATGAQLGCSATGSSPATLDIDLPAGANYQLWVDSVSNSTSGPFLLHFGVRPSAAILVPIWQDAVDALTAIGARVVTVDSSGVASPNDNASIANSTSSLAPSGAAYRFAANSTMSDLVSATVAGNSLVGAILDMAAAGSRMDVYAVAVDNPATPVNESLFVNRPAVTTATTATLRLSDPALGEPSPYNGSACTGSTGTPAYLANGCLAGTAVQFRAEWINNIVPLTTAVQEFHFDVIVYGSHGTTVVELGRIPVTIYVPPLSYPPAGTVTYTLPTPTCASGEQWQWASLQFDVDTPPMPRANPCADPGTRVQFSVQTALTAAGVPAAPSVVLGTAPCATSPIDMSAALIASGVSDRLPYLTLTIALTSFSGQTPTVRGYNILGHCQPGL